MIQREEKEEWGKQSDRVKSWKTEEAKHLKVLMLIQRQTLKKFIITYKGWCHHLFTHSCSPGFCHYTACIPECFSFFVLVFTQLLYKALWDILKKWKRKNSVLFCISWSEANQLVKVKTLVVASKFDKMHKKRSWIRNLVHIFAILLAQQNLGVFFLFSSFFFFFIFMSACVFIRLSIRCFFLMPWLWCMMWKEQLSIYEASIFAETEIICKEDSTSSWEHQFSWQKSQYNK